MQELAQQDSEKDVVVDNLLNLTLQEERGGCPLEKLHVSSLSGNTQRATLSVRLSGLLNDTVVHTVCVLAARTLPKLQDEGALHKKTISRENHSRHESGPVVPLYFKQNAYA